MFAAHQKRRNAAFRQNAASVRWETGPPASSTAALWAARAAASLDIYGQKTNLCAHTQIETSVQILACVCEGLAIRRCLQTRCRDTKGAIIWTPPFCPHTTRLLFCQAWRMGRQPFPPSKYIKVWKSFKDSNDTKCHFLWVQTRLSSFPISASVPAGLILELGFQNTTFISVKVMPIAYVQGKEIQHEFPFFNGWQTKEHFSEKKQVTEDVKWQTDRCLKSTVYRYLRSVNALKLTNVSV